MNKKRQKEEEEEEYFAGDNFLQKIKQYKSQSKVIKKKNTQLVHKNLWMNTWGDYKKKENALQHQLDSTLDRLQHKYKLFPPSQLQTIINDYDHFSNNVWVQTKNFNALLKELKGTKEKSKVAKFQPMFREIRQYIGAIEKKINSDYRQAQGSLGQTGDGTFISQVSTGLDLEKYSGGDLDQRAFYFEQLLQVEGEEQVLVGEYQQALHLMEMRYCLQAQKLLQDYPCLQKTPSGLQSTHSNAYARFRHLFDTYMNKGKDRELYSQRVQMEFPGISRTVMDEYDDYFRSLFFYNQKRKAERQMRLKEKEGLDSLTENQIYSSIEIRVQQQNRDMEKQKGEQSLLRILKEMGEMRREHQTRRQEEQSRAREEEEEEKGRKKREEKEKQVYQSSQKHKSKEYRSFKVAMHRQQVEQMEIARLEQKGKEREEVAKQKEKVGIRQAQRMDKIGQQKQEREFRQGRKEREEERLAHLIANYKDRPQVEMDTERLEAQTESLKIRGSTKMDMGDKLTLNGNKGYDVDRLMGDMRYKLNYYLSEAGLVNTPYAHEIISKINAPRPSNNLF